MWGVWGIEFSAFLVYTSPVLQTILPNLKSITWKSQWQHYRYEPLCLAFCFCLLNHCNNASCSKYVHYYLISLSSNPSSHPSYSLPSSLLPSFLFFFLACLPLSFLPCLPSPSFLTYFFLPSCMPAFSLSLLCQIFLYLTCCLQNTSCLFSCVVFNTAKVFFLSYVKWLSLFSCSIICFPAVLVMCNLNVFLLSFRYYPFYT